MRVLLPVFLLAAFPLMVWSEEESLCCPLGWTKISGVCYGRTPFLQGSSPKVNQAKRIDNICGGFDGAMPYNFQHSKATVREIHATFTFGPGQNKNEFHTSAVKQRLSWKFDTLFGGRKPAKKMAKGSKGASRKLFCLKYVVSRDRYVPTSCSIKRAAVCYGIPNTPCPVDGMWGNWEEWGTVCSSECVGGTVERTRACDMPPPEHGGAMCDGDDFEEKSCNDDIPCPVDGGWGEWYADGGDCDLWCGDSFEDRFRNCDSPSVVGTGADCVGSSFESGVFPCTYGACPVWTEWETSTCLPVCGSATLAYTRRCYSETYLNDGDDPYIHPEYCLQADPYNHIYINYPEDYQGASKAESCMPADVDGTVLLESCDSEHGKVNFFEINCDGTCDDIEISIVFHTAPTGATAQDGQVSVSFYEYNPYSQGGPACESEYSEYCPGCYGGYDCVQEFTLDVPHDHFVIDLEPEDNNQYKSYPNGEDQMYLLVGFEGTDAAIPAATYSIITKGGNVLSASKVNDAVGTILGWTV